LFIYENMHTTLGALDVGKWEQYEHPVIPAEKLSIQQVLERLSEF